MRNLKRALSLALATLMVVSMMVVGAGAVSLSDFSDSEKIANKEAVTVLTTLGVINGKDDGSYDPEGIVTRAEMAKMICVVLNGGQNPQLGETVKNSYTDTVGHWAAPYIEYCTTLGIVSGRGNGTFDPNGTVTVAEAGKMVLVALGYNAGVEGYVGANWQINVDVRANASSLRLYDGLGTLNTNVDLTRDNAAQMLYNALDAKMVEYSYVITGTADNSITTKPQLNDHVKGTLLWEKFGAVKVVGVVVGNEFADMSSTKKDANKAPTGSIIGSSLDAGKTEIVVTNYNDDDQTVYANKNYTFTVSTGEEELGKAVYMYVKPAANSTNTLKAEVIGSAIISDDNNVVTDASGDKAADVADDNNLDITDDTIYVYNYANSSTKIPAKDGVKGVQKTLVDIDSDGDVDYVLYKEMGLGKVTLYTEVKDGQIVVNVHNGNLINKDKADIIGFEDVEKDDYVLTAYFGGRLYVQEAETVTGTIEAYKQKGKGTTAEPFQNTGFTVDGQTYDVSYVDTYSGDLNVAKTAVDKSILSSEATFYMDLNGYVVAYGDVDESAYKYAYVWGAEAGNAIRDDKVKVTTEDGKTKTYDLNGNSDIDVVNDGTDNGRTTVDEDAMQGRVYGYSITSDGSIKLYLPKGGAVAQDKPIFTKGLTNIQFAGKVDAEAMDELTPSNVDVAETNAYYTGNATTFFYVTMKKNSSGAYTNDIDKVSVYNGRNNAPTVDGASGEAILALKNSRGDVGSVVFTNVSIAESAGDHMFVYDANYVWEDYGYVNTYFNGKTDAEKDVKVAYVDTLNGEIVHNPNVKDGIYLYKTTDKGYYEITKPTNESYYFEGIVARVNKAQNTFVITDDGTSTGNFRAEFQLTKDSIVVDYDSSHSSPVAYTNGSVSEGDTVQVIVNNQKDSEVLMAAIMDRKDSINPDDGTVDTSIITDGNITMIAPSNAAPISARVNSSGVINFNFKAPTGTALGAKVSYKLDIYLNGLLMESSTQTSGALTGNVVSGSSQVNTYDSTDKIKVVITDVAADMYTVTGAASNVVPTTTKLSTKNASTITFEVTGLSGVSKTDITYTVKGVYGGDYTQTVTGVTVTNGKATVTTANALKAVAPVTISVSATTTGEVPVTYKVTGDKNFTVSGGTQSLTTAAAGGTLANLTITMPANVASYDYSVTVSGLTTTPAAVTGSNKTANETVSGAPFDNSTKYVAAGPVTVTVAISNVVTKYAFNSVVADAAVAKASGDWTFTPNGGTAVKPTENFEIDSTGFVTGKLEATITALDVPGTATVTAATGATGTASVHLDRGETDLSIAGLTLSDFDGNPVILRVTFEADKTYAITNGQATAGTVNGSKNTYEISAIKVGTAAVTEAAKDETVTVTVTAANASTFVTETVSVVATGASGTATVIPAEIEFTSAGTSDCTFTMPNEAVTLTVTYTAP